MKMKLVTREYCGIREGEIVELVEVTPSYFDRSSPSGFTWPEYITVKTSTGKIVTGHSYRFKKVE